LTPGRFRPVFTIVVWTWAAALLVSFVVVGTLLLPVTTMFDRDRRLPAAIACRFLRLSLLLPTCTKDAMAALAAARAHGAVLVVNHTSVIDIALCVAAHGAPRLAAKPWVSRLPLFRYSMWIAGHAVFDPADVGDVREMMDRMAAYLDQGVSVVFFPEGTRGTPGGMGKFQRGAFRLAVRASRPVIPIVVHGSATCIPNGTMRVHEARVTCDVLEGIDPGDDPIALMKRTREVMLSRLDDPPG